MAENNDSQSMMLPVILTLAISEQEKNNPEVISSIQEKILELLKNQNVENITRYQYTPLMAISVDQAGLDILEASDHVSKISNDGLSAPQSNKPPVDSTTQLKPPCDHKTE